MINSLMIISHYNCNFNCKYCNQREIASNDRLNYKEVFNFIKWLFDNNKISNNFFIQFEGGETLFRWKDFIKPLVEKIENELPIKVSYGIFTNGTIYTKELFNFLEKNNFTITLSIDGDKKVFSYQRNLKYFNLVKLNMNKYSKLPKTRVNAVFTPETVKDLYNSYIFFKNNGIKNISFSPDNRNNTKWEEYNLKEITSQFVKILEDDKEKIVYPQNSLWNSVKSKELREKEHNQQLRIYPNGKITFGSDPFLKNEIKGENCSLKNYQKSFIDLDNISQSFILTNKIEKCNKCISQYICPKPTGQEKTMTSPALCAMRIAFLMEEKLENG